MDQRIEARIAALEMELQRLQEAVAEQPESSPPTSDRRGMVKLLAASAVGAVTGAAMLGAKPAAAADTDPVLQGGINNASSATTLTSSTDTALILYGAGGYGIQSDGGLANALFSGSGASPVGLPSGLGELYVDANGDWWAGTADSQPNGVWRKLAGTGTAGQLHILPSPVRVYDSRPNQAPSGVLPKSPLAGNTPRILFMTASGSGVPVEASAVMITLTITAPATGGFATAWPQGAWPGTSNINFAAGQDVATTTVVGCGPNASIQVQSNTVTDFLVDVIGYYQ